MNLLYSSLHIENQILNIKAFYFFLSILAFPKSFHFLKRIKKLYLISSKISQIKEKATPIGKSSIIQNSQLSEDQVNPGMIACYYRFWNPGNTKSHRFKPVLSGYQHLDLTCGYQ
jgi:hypothetical protein